METVMTLEEIIFDVSLCLYVHNIFRSFIDQRRICLNELKDILVSVLIIKFTVNLFCWYTIISIFYFLVLRCVHPFPKESQKIITDLTIITNMFDGRLYITRFLYIQILLSFYSVRVFTSFLNDGVWVTASLKSPGFFQVSQPISTVLWSGCSLFFLWSSVRLVSFQVFGFDFKSSNHNWYHCYLYFPLIFQPSGKILVFVYLYFFKIFSLWFAGTRKSTKWLVVFFNSKSGLHLWIEWFVCISMSQRVLFVSFSGIDSGLFKYYLGYGQTLVSCTFLSGSLFPSSHISFISFVSVYYVFNISFLFEH